MAFNHYFGLFAVGLLAIACAGCDAIPLSQHPLSTEETSQLDEALFGQWDMFGEQQAAAAEKPPTAGTEKHPPTTEPPPDPEGPPRVAIGKQADKESTHEMLMVAVQDDGSIEIKRLPLQLTRIGEQRMISLKMNPEAEQADYAILRYEVINSNRVLLYMLDSDFIAAAIQKGQLKGTVKNNAGNDDPNAVKRRDSIRITAPPQELKDFLAKHDKKAFTAKPAWRLQRAAAN